jgi:hypothetical protein
LAVTCWHIWEARNNTRNGRGHLHPIRVASKIKAYVDNIVEFYYKQPTVKRCVSMASSKWTPPLAGSLCVNVDAMVFSADHRMGMRMVVRDHSGTLKFSCSEGIAGITIAELVEAIAIRRALEVSRDNSFQAIILASHCLSMIQRIQVRERD